MAMGIAALLSVGIGIYPQALYDLLPYEVNYTAYDTTHVLAQLQLLFFSALAFVWLNLRGIYPPELHSVNIDAEWLYRKLAPQSIRYLVASATPTYRAASRSVRNFIEFGIIKNLVRYHGPEGILARAWLIGNMVLWVALLLGLYLVLYYFQ